nr:MAG TPA: LAMBDA REPRESSOR (TRIPLE MUTANT)/DNA COMPLEX-DNA COMPLEX, DOUBLE HELIX, TRANSCRIPTION-DNA.1A [Bacteriophage sp.]
MAFSSVAIDRIKLNVAMARKDYGLRELSNISGVSITSLSYIRSGKRCMKKTADAIAEALGITTEEILLKQ